MNILYIVAMEEEAKPFIDHYGVKLVPNAFSPLPCRLYQRQLTSPRGGREGASLSIVINGKQHGSNLIGCEAVSVTTVKAIEQLHPDLVINSGTCGGFISDGADIAKVYIANGVMFHDRRVPGDNEWDTQGLGNYPVYEHSKDIADVLGMPMGKVTTGSSLDMQPCDLEIIKHNGGQLKDMEGAAVAYVCTLYNIPCMLVKSVTDLCDGGEKTIDEFLQNLGRASEALRDANIRIIDYLTNKLQHGQEHPSSFILHPSSIISHLSTCSNLLVRS